ncbi:MAG TPA: methyltransferase domain-containing protein [Anaeromyxobacter sp.]|nr:methyltransferase domain-containing protein [Anaeromyxobacter sp.]
MDLVELALAPTVRHPWEETRSRFFLRVLDRAGIVVPGVEVLDVGAGDAWFARELSDRFPAIARVACWDTAYEARVLAGPAFAPSPRIAFSRERPRGAFGLLLLLDVLEHVEHDGAFLDALVRESLAPGGYALVSVPAWPALFASHDVNLRHHRRYAPASARALLRASGLELVASGGLFGGPLFVRAAQVAADRMLGPRPPPPHVGDWNAPAPVTGAVRAVLACDAWVALAAARLGLQLPGLSWWALCRKPAG